MSATGSAGCVARGSRCKVNDGVNVNVAVDVKGWVKVIVEDKVNSSYPSRVAACCKTLEAIAASSATQVTLRLSSLIALQQDQAPSVFPERASTSLIDRFSAGRGADIVDPGYWWLAWHAPNLLFACVQCNRQHKRSAFPLASGSVALAAGSHPPGSTRGLQTIETLQLNRDALVEHDSAHVHEVLRPRIDDLKRRTEPRAFRDAWSSNLRSLLRASSTFPALSHDVLDYYFPPAVRAASGAELPRPPI